MFLLLLFFVFFILSEITKLQPKEVIQTKGGEDLKGVFLDEKTRILYLGKPTVKRYIEIILEQLVKVLKVTKAKHRFLYVLLHSALPFLLFLRTDA